jgi:hypothetical protein
MGVEGRRTWYSHLDRLMPAVTVLSPVTYLLFGALFSPLSRALHSILLILARYSLAREIDFPLSGTTLRRDLCPLGKPLGLVVPLTLAAPVDHATK